MDEQLKYLQKLIPEQLEILIRRYEILRTASLLGLTGRRRLSEKTGLSERIVRGDTEKLAEEGLLLVAKYGMSVTPEGQAALNCLKEAVYSLTGLSRLEAELEAYLGVKRVVLVQGDCDRSGNVKGAIGAAAAKELLKQSTPQSVIALTGGSTVEQVILHLPSCMHTMAAIVVPARGSVGHKVEQQSDTLAAKLAEKFQAEYRLLNVPDNMSSRAMNEMKQEPTVKDTLCYMKKTDILLFGVGDALQMARKRRVSEPVYEYLKRKNAVVEALGYYFNENGEIVYEARSLSISLEEVKKIPCVISVAGGHKKAVGIAALSKILPHMTMVFDEGAAFVLKELAEKEGQKRAGGSL